MPLSSNKIYAENQVHKQKRERSVWGSARGGDLL